MDWCLDLCYFGGGLFSFLGGGLFLNSKSKTLILFIVFLFSF